jgi:hypothetical protein
MASTELPVQILNPSQDIQAVTPSDSAALPGLTRFLYIGVTGDVTVIDNNANTTLFKAVPAGGILPIAVTKVKATGTTATYIVAGY